MKIKPVVREELKTRHTSFEVNFHFEYNVTFICGDSGVGKSAVFSFIKEAASQDKTIRCFNYLDKLGSYKQSIKKSKGKLFVIDNADVLLNDDLRHYIAFDVNNQYLILGRNPRGLLLTMDEIYELDSQKEADKTLFTLRRAF